MTSNHTIQNSSYIFSFTPWKHFFILNYIIEVWFFSKFSVLANNVEWWIETVNNLITKKVYLEEGDCKAI
jgi:hypothetical protein